MFPFDFTEMLKIATPFLQKSLAELNEKLRKKGYRTEIDKKLQKFQVNRVRGVFLADRINWTDVNQKLQDFKAEYKGDFPELEYRPRTTSPTTKQINRK